MHASRTLGPFLSAFAVTLASLAGSNCGTPPSTNASTEDVDPADVLALHDEGLLGNSLTRTEVQTVLKLVDDVCGDTWCEGDNDFRFRHLFCQIDAGTCTLLFQMGARQEPPNPPDWRWRTCTTSGFAGFDSLVNTTSNGYQWLADSYYQALSGCIDRLDAASPQP